MVIVGFQPQGHCLTCDDETSTLLIAVAAALALLFVAALIVSAVQKQIPNFDPKTPFDPTYVVVRRGDDGANGGGHGGHRV